MTQLLTRDQILSADDLKSEVVSVPEWGGSVRVKTLTGSQRDEFEASIVTLEGKKAVIKSSRGIRALLASLSICDDKGAAVFSKEDVEKLAAKSSLALDRVFGVASRLSGLNEKDVKELEAGLEPAQGGSVSSK